MSKPENLSRDAIRSLTWIILTALMGIITLSIAGALLRAGVFTSSEPSDAFTTADEALSILGNIAAAAVGGLVGWLTRDLVASKGDYAVPYDRHEKDPEPPLPPPDFPVYTAEIGLTKKKTKETKMPFEAEHDVSGPDPDDTVETVMPDYVELDQEPDDDDDDDPDPQDDAEGAPDHPDELEDEEDPALSWEDEPKSEEGTDSKA